MPRPAKDYIYLNIKLDREISNALTDFCDRTGRTKTGAIEMILKDYLREEGYMFQKKISKNITE